MEHVNHRKAPTIDGVFVTCGLARQKVKETLKNAPYLRLGRAFYINQNTLPAQDPQREEEIYKLQCLAAKTFYKKAVIAYESAARWWGLYSWFDYPDIHLALPGIENAHYHVTHLPATKENQPTQTRIKRHQMHFLPGDVVVQKGIPITSLPRTIIDIAARTHPLPAYVMTCAGLRKLVNPKPGETTHTILKRENQTKNQLLARLEKTHKHRRLRGYRWAKQILLNASALCESPLEAAFSWHWLANSYPPFKRQHEFGHKKHAPYRADIYIPNKNLIIELDGASKLQQPGAHQDQTTRENIIHQHGYHLIRLNLPQVVAGHPVLKTATQITQTPPKHTRYLWARTKNLALNQLKTLRRRP